tara:strand:+ start:16579 stop:16746 length:168 start_codon:yes stop_codon:yes gene_type:complete
MNLKLRRHDGLEDNLTSLIFFNYEEAYDYLEKEFGYLCCTDSDFEEDTFYEIIKI